MGIVNTYDPADHIMYLHVAPLSDFCATLAADTVMCHRLPVGYANQPPRTPGEWMHAPDDCEHQEPNPLESP